MRMTLRKNPAGFRRGTALFLLLAVLAGMLPACADTGGGNGTIDDITGQTQLTLAAAALEKNKETDADLQDITIRQNGQVYGRGISDEPSGAEPKYTGLVGYAVAANNASITFTKESAAFPWEVPGYLLYEKRWYYTKALQHKTSVLVVRQVLKEVGDGVYTGRLKVIRLDTGETCWMDVENFITVPYWFYPVRRAVRYGNTVAAYKRKGRRLPINETGRTVRVENDTNVLIPGNGVWDKRSPEGSRMIPGVIFTERMRVVNGKEFRETVANVLLFPEEDLTMIY